MKYKPKEKDLQERQYFKRLLVISQDQGYGSLINSVDCLPKFGDWKLTAISRRLEKVVEADWVKPGFFPWVCGQLCFELKNQNKLLHLYL